MAKYKVIFTLKSDIPSIEGNDWKINEEGGLLAPEEAEKTIAARCIIEFFEIFKNNKFNNVSLFNFITDVKLFVSNEDGEKCVKEWDGSDFRK